MAQPAAANAKSGKPVVIPPYVINLNGKVICHIDRGTRAGTYFLDAACPQYKYVPQIGLQGFTAFPSGLKRNGKGFATTGYLVLKHLTDKLGPYNLTIDATAPSSVRRTKKLASVVLNQQELGDILRGLRKLKAESYQAQNELVAGHLAQQFPQHFAPPDEDRITYRSGEVSALLTRRDILKHLSTKDVDALSAFFPRFLKEYSERVVGTEKLLALSKSKRAVEIVYMDKITKEFERRLKKTNASENSWQTFLREYIL